MASRTVLITGAGKRMGAAIATHLASQGWNILIHYNQSGATAQALAAELMARFPIQAWTVQADLGDPTAAKGLIAASQRAAGVLPDAVINNASVFDYDTIDTLGVAQWQATMQVNLLAPVLLSQALAEALGERKACIINLLDQKLFNLNPDYFSYTISKMALEGATRLLAQALAPRGIRVCAVAPGISMPSGDQTQADFELAHKATPLGRSSTPDDIARAIAYLLDADAVTGQILTVDGGQHLLPLQRDVMFLARADKNASSA